MSVSIYNILLYIILLLFITNSDKSPTMKEKSLYSIIQLNANVTWVFLYSAKDDSNLKALNIFPVE